MFQPGFKKIHVFSRQQSLGKKKRHFLFFMLGYDFGEMFSRRLKTFLILFLFSFFFPFQKGKSYIYDLLQSVSSAAIKRRRAEIYKAKMKRKEKRRSCLFGLRFIDHPRCELKNSGLLYASFHFYFLPLFSFLKKKTSLLPRASPWPVWAPAWRRAEQRDEDAVSSVNQGQRAVRQASNTGDKCHSVWRYCEPVWIY